MLVLQHYYTSYVNKENGSAGFQIKAMSHGIPPDILTLIARLIAYRIPPSLADQAIAAHPVALRYYFKDPYTCILLCTQSSGPDEIGRPGNFFAHTVVLEPSQFTSIPPIFFWQNSFWQKTDPLERTELAPLTEFPLEPTLDLVTVWSFLIEGQRQQQLYPLLCALLQANKTQRRIIIDDTVEHIALWIAIISCLLPPVYRPLLSFATYHHDPTQAQFMITGVTTDTLFHMSADDQRTYFVLHADNAVSGSVVEDSIYAELVAQVGDEERYEALLLPFFAEVVPYFPAPQRIDQQLDMMARYYRLCTDSPHVAVTEEDLTAIRVVLGTFEHLTDWTPEDEHALHILAVAFMQILLAPVEKPPASVLYIDYQRVLKLFQERGLADDELKLIELQYVSQQMIFGQIGAWGEIALVLLLQRYGEDDIDRILRRQAYLHWLTKCAEHATAQQLQRLWMGVGSYLHPTIQCRELFRRSISVIDEALKSQQKEDAVALQHAMKCAMEGNGITWLTSVMNNTLQYPQEGLNAFYYTLVRDINIAQREPYHKLMQACYPDVLLFEIQTAISEHKAAQGLSLLEEWEAYLSNREGEEITHQLLSEALSYWQKRCQSQWPALAPKILLSRLVPSLSAKMEKQLIYIMTAHISFSHFSPAYVEIYRKYHADPRLYEESQTILTGLLAMASGEFSELLIGKMRQRLRIVSYMQYESEIDAFLREFLQTPFSQSAHTHMLMGLFSFQYAMLFWKQYKKHLLRLLTVPEKCRCTINILSCWFGMRPKDSHTRYILQSFLFHLPTMLREASTERAFYETTQDFCTLAASEPWYVLIKEYFIERKSVLASTGQVVTSRWQRLMKGRQKEKHKVLRGSQEPESAFKEIFDEKSARKNHELRLQSLYLSVPREQFWSMYWPKFLAYVLSQEVEQILQLLTFWFDQSFDTFQDSSYLAQDFFLSLSGVLETGLKERNFRARVRLIDEFVQEQRGEPYAWYALLSPCFERYRARYEP